MNRKTHPLIEVKYLKNLEETVSVMLIITNN
jgi:hypothetical protein